MAALVSYSDASSPAAEEAWWKEALGEKAAADVQEAVKDWREGGGMLRRDLSVLATQLPELDVRVDNFILDDGELFARGPSRDSRLAFGIYGVVAPTPRGGRVDAAEWSRRPDSFRVRARAQRGARPLCDPSQRVSQPVETLPFRR